MLSSFLPLTVQQAPERTRSGVRSADPKATRARPLYSTGTPVRDLLATGQGTLGCLPAREAETYSGRRLAG